MAILSQILGSSFGRGPAQMTPIHMPGINIPGMAPDPNANAYRTQQDGQQQPAQGQGGQQGQSIDDVINGFKARLEAMRNGGGVAGGGQVGVGGAQGIGPEPAPVPVDFNSVPLPTGATGAAGGIPGMGAGAGGVMGSIGSAFNAGAGGGLDMSKLMSLLPMLGL